MFGAEILEIDTFVQNREIVILGCNLEGSWTFGEGWKITHHGLVFGVVVDSSISEFLGNSCHNRIRKTVFLHNGKPDVLNGVELIKTDPRVYHLRKEHNTHKGKKTNSEANCFALDTFDLAAKFDLL